jgi:alpha-glucosidase
MARSPLDILRGIRFIGASNTFATISYAIRQARLNRRTTQGMRDSAAKPPGDLLHALPIPQGARFTFERAALEILFLAPGLIRTSWTPGDPPVPYAITDRSWERDAVDVSERDGRWRVGGTQYAVEVSFSGEVSYLTSDQRKLRQEGIPVKHGTAWEVETHLPEQAVVLGLGERAAGLNLRGGSYRFWNLDPGGSYAPGHDPLYACIPVYFVLQDAGSYLVFYENAFDGRLDLSDHARLRFERGMLRSYWIPGKPVQALSQYAELTGKAPLPPRWALGYHQSRWGYRTQREVLELAAQFEEHDLALDVIHLDLDYMHGNRVFTVDEKRFPDLPGMAGDLARKGVHLVTILDPGVKVERGYDVFESGQRQDAFCRLPGGRLAQAPVWPGWSAFPDFTLHAARKWWSGLYPRLLELGISGIWHDMNEPSAFSAWGEPTLPLATQHALDGQTGDHRAAHNLYGLLMNQAGFEALRQHRRQARPFLLSRSGWAGVQRFAWLWTGDTESTWEMLGRTISMLLGLGMSGVPYSGSDVGGFSGKPSAELYLRWLQLAAFTPFFRTHSALGTPRREPWAYNEETLLAARACLELRRRLMPYLYTQAWRTSQHGLPLMRPMFWDEPDNQDLWEIEDQFFLGDSLLVAPVVTPGAFERTVVLPPGTWHDFATGQQYGGPGEITLPVALESIPLFIRAGSLLPMNEGEGLNLLIVLPGDGEAGFHYQDAGDGYGPWQLDRYLLAADKGSATLKREVDGHFPGAAHRLSLQTVGMEVVRAEAGGRPLEAIAGCFEVAPFQELTFFLE